MWEEGRRGNVRRGKEGGVRCGKKEEGGGLCYLTAIFSTAVLLDLARTWEREDGSHSRVVVAHCPPCTS